VVKPKYKDNLSLNLQSVKIKCPDILHLNTQSLENLHPLKQTSVSTGSVITTGVKKWQLIKKTSTFTFLSL